MFSQKQDDPVLFVCLFVCLFVFIRSELLWVEELNWIERGKRRWGTSDAISTRHVEFLRRTVHTYSLRLLCNLICCFSFLNFRCIIKVRYCSRYDLAWCRLIDFVFQINMSKREGVVSSRWRRRHYRPQTLRFLDRARRLFSLSVMRKREELWGRELRRRCQQSDTASLSDHQKCQAWVVD